VKILAAVSSLRVAKEDHPNRLPFSGVLLFLDQPSQQAPHGSKGHRIYVSKEVATRHLDTLRGMPLNYDAGGLEDHDSSNAVGVITEPWIEGNKVMVKGYIWKKTFPEAKDDLHGKALGMSMELADVEIEDPNADIWRLNSFYFTGATALWPDSAAYTSTALAAAAAKQGRKGDTMAEKTKKKVVVPDSAKAVADAIAASVAVQVNKQIGATQTPLLTAITELTSVVRELKAGGAAKPQETPEEEASRKLVEAISGAATKDEDADEDADIDAAEDGENPFKKKKDGEEEDDEEDEDDDEEMEGAGGSGDPTNVNDDVANKGHKTSETGPAGGASMKMSAETLKTMKAAGTVINELRAANARLTGDLKKEKVERKKLNGRMTAMEAQLEAAAERTNRRTVTPELLNLLEKNGIDIQASQAAGKKIPVAQLDQMFASCGFPLDIEMRMAFKNQLKSAGMLAEQTM